MLIDNNLFGEIDLVKIAIERLQHFEPEEGYYFAFSGGKDSITIEKLAEMSGVKYDAHYNLTTIDPPELIYFIRDYYPDVIIDKSEKPFLQRMIEKGFPRRQSRWCCEEFKERGGIGRFVVTGVRKAESNNRKNRRMVEFCLKDSTKKFLHVIIDWTDEDVWEFIRKYNVPYCKLYDEGWKRIGCLFCPCATKKNRLREIELYPRFAKQFIRSFEELYNDRKINAIKKFKKDGTPDRRFNNPSPVDRWGSGEEMFWWWIYDNRQYYNKSQTVIFE